MHTMCDGSKRGRGKMNRFMIAVSFMFVHLDSKERIDVTAVERRV